jgi:adenylate kinase
MLTQRHHRGYSEKKLDGNVDSEIFGYLLEEAHEAYDQEIVIELISETSEHIDSNCARITAWVESWKEAHSIDEDSTESDA